MSEAKQEAFEAFWQSPVEGGCSYAECYGESHRLVAQEAYLAGRAALLEPVGEGWVSVEERLPAPGKPVLAFYKNSHGLGRTTRAHHSPKHTVDASTWEDGSDDTECGSYEPEGWWEDPTEAEALAFICHDVTHWMPLPASPKSNGGMGS